MPNGKVILSHELMKISGWKYAFQLELKVNIPSPDKAGPASGMAILIKIIQWVAPSILAASTSSCGRDKKC